MKHLYHTGCDFLSYGRYKRRSIFRNSNLRNVEISEQSPLISMGVFAVGGGVEREGVLKLMLATRRAIQRTPKKSNARILTIPTHTTGDSYLPLFERPTVMRPQKYKNEQISVDHFLWEARYFFFFFFFFNLTFSRWTSSLPSCLWSQRIFPSLPASRLTIFYRDASSALLQLVNQWLNFTYSRSHAFRYERKDTNPTLVRIELTTSALAGVQVNY